MQIDYLITFWYVGSFLLQLVSTVALWRWLRNRNVKLSFSLITAPWYLEHKYITWCKENGRPYQKVIGLLGLIMLNFIAAIAVVVWQSHGK
jgi:hypothetical protein